jgi:hypothetical protein
VGSLGWDNAIGVVDEVRLITKPPVAAPVGRVNVLTTKSGFALMTLFFPGKTPAGAHPFPDPCPFTHFGVCERGHIRSIAELSTLSQNADRNIRFPTGNAT